MTKRRTDFDRYMVVERETGDVIPVDVFLEAVPPGYWEKAYAKTLAEYIGVVGNASSTILAWVLTHKDSNNLIHGSFAEIAEECATTRATVNALFQKLYKKELLKKIRNGCYMVSPEILRHGSKTRGAMVLRLWRDS